MSLRRYRQSVVAISSCRRTLPFWLLSAQTAASEHSVNESGCSEDFSPGNSSRADSTTVIRSCTTYQTTCCKRFNPYRMLPNVWLLESGGAIASLQSYRSCTGFLFIKG